MIPFALMTADGRSTSLNAQRLVNMYAEKAEAGAKAEMILRSTPGLETNSTNGSGAVRNLHKMNIANAETVFAVIGGRIILGERLPSRGLFGCALMLGGMLLSQIDIRSKFLNKNRSMPQGG